MNKITRKPNVLYFINFMRKFDKEYNPTPKSINREKKSRNMFYQKVIKKKLGGKKNGN